MACWNCTHCWAEYWFPDLRCLFKNAYVFVLSGRGVRRWLWFNHSSTWTMLTPGKWGPLIPTEARFFGVTNTTSCLQGVDIGTDFMLNDRLSLTQFIHLFLYALSSFASKCTDATRSCLILAYCIKQISRGGGLAKMTSCSSGDRRFVSSSDSKNSLGLSDRLSLNWVPLKGTRKEIRRVWCCWNTDKSMALAPYIP